jgi:hypothetical protein
LGNGHAQSGTRDDTNGETDDFTHEFVHMLGSEEVAGPNDAAIGFAHVRVEVWRYHFDPNQNRLLATQVLAVRSAQRLAKGRE